MTENLKLYIDELNKQYKTGLAREHSYRPALKDLLQSLLPKMVVTNEPAHFLTSSLVRYFYLPHDGTYGFKGGSEDLTGDAG